MTRYNEKTKAYSIKYARERLKRVPLDLPMEEYEQLRAAAGASSEPVNTYIKKAIRQRMERDKAGAD